MTLRRKTLAAFVATMAALIALVGVASNALVLGSIRQLEVEDTRQDVDAVLGELQDEIGHLDEVCLDWANWDEPYQFAQSLDPTFVDRNLVPKILTNLKLNVVILFSREGTLLLGRTFDLAGADLLPLSGDLQEWGRSHNHLVTYRDPQDGHRGAVLAGDRPMLMASRPLLDSEGRGTIAGTILMGRYIDEQMVRRLADVTHRSIKLLRYDDPALDAGFQEARSSLSAASPIMVRPIDEDRIAGYALLRDVFGSPALLLRVEMPRAIYRQGRAVEGYLLASVAIATLLCGAAALLLLDRQILSRLARMHATMARVKESGDLSIRTSIAGTDELASLASTMNGMMDALVAAQQRLQEESENRFRHLAENATDIIYRVDFCPAARFSYVSPAVTRVLGYTPEEVYNDPNLPHKSVHPEDRELLETMMLHQVVTPHTVIRWQHKEGRTVWLEARVAPVLDDSGKLVAVEGIARDITEKRHLEEQLMRAQRMEGAGRIAAQVAHNFNNLLGPLAGYPQLIKMQLPPNHPVGRHCDTMLEAVERMVEINDEMLILAKASRFEDRMVDLNELVAQTADRLVDWPCAIAVRTLLAPDLMAVRGSPAQFSRAIMNLVTNARDAMGQAGILTLTTENIYLDQPIGRYNRVEIGEYVRLTVADTGCGISASIRDRIFDPFFSTKHGSRRGSGLGLSIVQAIVADGRGYVDVESEAGKGTTFTIYLPVARAASAPEPAVPLARGAESILVVDDDRFQRALAEDILRSAGYLVESVSSGHEALNYLREHPVDLVVLDMVMPGGMDGSESYRRILEIRPGQRAILISGFAETGKVRNAQALGAGALVSKPLTLETLAEAVRRELDREPAGSPCASPRDAAHA